jgi:ribosomal subunit interface protein
LEITITSRNVEITDNIKKIINKNFDKLKRLVNDVIKMKLVVEKEKYLFSGELNVYVKGMVFNSKGYAESINKLIADIFSKLARQLRKKEGIIRSHRHKNKGYS